MTKNKIMLDTQWQEEYIGRDEPPIHLLSMRLSSPHSYPSNPRSSAIDGGFSLLGSKEPMGLGQEGDF